jgi:hypothetical protein
MLTGSSLPLSRAANWTRRRTHSKKRCRDRRSHSLGWSAGHILIDATGPHDEFPNEGANPAMVESYIHANDVNSCR